MNQETYIARLQEVIQNLHLCESRHLGAEFVEEKINGQTVWRQVVEIFELSNHSRANRCSAWRDAKGYYRAVVHRGPVKNAKDAVKYTLISESDHLVEDTNAPKEFMEVWRQFRLRPN